MICLFLTQSFGKKKIFCWKQYKYKLKSWDLKGDVYTLIYKLGFDLWHMLNRWSATCLRILVTSCLWQDIEAEHAPTRTGATSVIQQIIFIVSSGYTQFPRTMTFGHYSSPYMWLSCKKKPTEQSQNQFVTREERGLHGVEKDPDPLGRKAERSIWLIKELILLGSGYNILPWMPSNRKSETVPKHTIPLGGTSTGSDHQAELERSLRP